MLPFLRGKLALVCFLFFCLIAYSPISNNNDGKRFVTKTRTTTATFSSSHRWQEEVPCCVVPLCFLVFPQGWWLVQLPFDDNNNCILLWWWQQQPQMTRRGPLFHDSSLFYCFFHRVDDLRSHLCRWQQPQPPSTLTAVATDTKEEVPCFMFSLCFLFLNSGWKTAAATFNYNNYYSHLWWCQKQLPMTRRAPLFETLVCFNFFHRVDNLCSHLCWQQQSQPPLTLMAEAANTKEVVPCFCVLPLFSFFKFRVEDCSSCLQWRQQPQPWWQQQPPTRRRAPLF